MAHKILIFRIFLGGRWHIVTFVKLPQGAYAHSGHTLDEFVSLTKRFDLGNADPIRSQKIVDPVLPFCNADTKIFYEENSPQVLKVFFAGFWGSIQSSMFFCRHAPHLRSKEVIHQFICKGIV